MGISSHLTTRLLDETLDTSCIRIAQCVQTLLLLLTMGGVRGGRVDRRAERRPSQ